MWRGNWGKVARSSTEERVPQPSEDPSHDEGTIAHPQTNQQISASLIPKFTAFTRRQLKGVTDEK
jgi:hypothetical protein